MAKPSPRLMTIDSMPIAMSHKEPRCSHMKRATKLTLTTEYAISRLT